jgi:alpha-1,3-rhamnosyltransferase
MDHEHPTPESGLDLREQPRVSVVVPVFNHAPFVEATLRSVFNQTLVPSELIVIDDGSSDDSLLIAERVLADSPVPSQFIKRANRGLCATLNEGLSRTSGEYFAYLGSDDLWLPEFLAARVAMLESRPRAVLGYGHSYLIDATEKIVDCTQDWASYSDGDVREMLLRTVAPMSPTVLYRREALERHRWNEGARLEDYDLYLRLSVEGEFAFDPRVLSAWRRHDGNASGNQRMMLEEHLSAQRRVLPDQGMSEKEIEELQTRVKFSRAEDFMRVGDKRGGLEMMVKNIGGAASAGHLVKLLLRLMTPQGILARRMSRRVARFNGIKLSSGF